MMYAGMLVSYGALLLLRLLFFSSRRGALLHNRWLLWFNRHLALNPESGPGVVPKRDSLGKENV